MEILDLKQGSEEWHQHRAEHFNASDAPAMMGVSAYKTRTQLLDEMKTGITPEIDAATQRRFDDGHRFEALARTHVEKILGVELFPVVGVSGTLSASFDGIDLLEEVLFEHKTLNDSIRGCETADQLPAQYRIQMEQQLLVSGAQRCCFSATKWDASNTLAEEKAFFYVPDKKLRAKIVAGWKQFEKDLEAHSPSVAEVKPQANAIMELPALSVQATGMVTSSNVVEFAKAAENYLENINTELSTDEDFANAEATVKFCKSTEEKLEVTKSAILSQTASIDEVIRTVNHIQEQLRSNRLSLAKLVKVEKETRKREIVCAAGLALSAHIESLEPEIEPITLIIDRPSFAEATKGLKTISRMQDKIDVALANGKIEADAVAKDIRDKQAWYAENNGDLSTLFPDLQSIIYKPLDDFKLTVTSRITEHEKYLKEKEVARLKAEQEAAERKAAEEKAKPDIRQAAEPKAEPASANIKPITDLADDAVVAYQDKISTFLAERNFKDENLIRAILVEFVKHVEAA